MKPHTSSDECPRRVDGYCKCNTTSTLNGKWPSDTWFQRARSRASKAESERLDIENAKMREVQ